MAALIAGNTLSELSQNSLIDDAARQGAYENAMNRARRAYEYGTLSAQDRERTNQLMAENALRRELGLGDIGVRSRDADVREKIGMGEIGVRGRGVDVQRELGLGQIANQNAMLDWQKKYLESGGDTRMPALMAANRANQLFQSEKQLARGELINQLDTTFTSRATAERVADKIISGEELSPADRFGSALKAKLWYDTVRMPQARQSVFEQLGESAGVITPTRDERGNELYVPAFGAMRTPQVTTTTSAPANQLAGGPTIAAAPAAATIKMALGPDGRYVRVGGGAVHAPQRPVVASNAPPIPQRTAPDNEGFFDYYKRYWGVPSDIGSRLQSGAIDAFIGGYDAVLGDKPATTSKPVNWFGMGGY